MTYTRIASWSRELAVHTARSVQHIRRWHLASFATAFKHAHAVYQRLMHVPQTTQRDPLPSQVSQQQVACIAHSWAVGMDLYAFVCSSCPNCSGSALSSRDCRASLTTGRGLARAKCPTSGGAADVEDGPEGRAWIMRSRVPASGPHVESYRRIAIASSASQYS